MIDTTDYQVRTEMLPPQPAPAGETGVRKWIWENLLASMSNFSSPAAALSSVLMIILTFSSILVIYWVVTTVFKFAIIDAIWSGTDGSYCRNANNRGKVPDGVEIGACWAFIDAKFGQLMNGFYPVAERWRVYLTYVIGAAVILPLAIPAIPHKGLNGFLLVFVFPVVAVVLLAGGWFGMPYVE
ncbi:MAG TPA: amino acid ABC transporter permease, partial [Rhizobiales bacterium]|nr:amino acid ABC transporter permease [Hyphomicrobiales bacterium]